MIWKLTQEAQRSCYETLDTGWNGKFTGIVPIEGTGGWLRLWQALCEGGRFAAISTQSCSLRLSTGVIPLMAIADLPRRSSNIIQDVCPFYELEGDTSRSLIVQFRTAMLQWLDRSGVLAESIAETESISHLRFPKAGTMRVRFKTAGAMTPRVIDVEE